MLVASRLDSLFICVLNLILLVIKTTSHCFVILKFPVENLFFPLELSTYKLDQHLNLLALHSKFLKCESLKDGCISNKNMFKTQKTES